MNTLIPILCSITVLWLTSCKQRESEYKISFVASGEPITVTIKNTQAIIYNKHKSELNSSLLDLSAYEIESDMQARIIAQVRLVGKDYLLYYGDCPNPTFYLQQVGNKLNFNFAMVGNKLQISTNDIFEVERTTDRGLKIRDTYKLMGDSLFELKQ